jgi:WD40 repeat protein
MMKVGAMILAAAAVAFGDVTPRASTFNPRRIAEERSFDAPNLWLVSAGGRYIATQTGADAFGLIDTSTGKDVGAFGDHGGMGRHDGNWGQSDRLLATAGSDGTVKVWDATTRKEVVSIAGRDAHAGYT